MTRFNPGNREQHIPQILICLGILLPLLCSFPTTAYNEQAGTKLGIDILLEKKIDVLKGKSIGLITNQTGCNSELLSTIDLLHKHPELNLIALFAPEHGIRGEIKAGQSIQSCHDKRTGLPVYSLYGKTKRPTDKMLRGIDVLLFDIQDIGVRWYTYISTMAIAMEEAGKRGIEFIVLDRPNPFGGLKIEGPVLGKHQRSFIGRYPIPVVHGMTAGELALFYQGEFKVPVTLEVVLMEGWNRSMVWNDTGLTWIPTSPNIPTLESAFVYPGMGLVGETGLVSIGIGSTLPFQIASAPWISPQVLAKQMNDKHLPGVIFELVSISAGRKKRTGVHIQVTDSRGFMPLSTALHLLEAIRNLYPDRFISFFKQNNFDKYLGSSAMSKALKKGENIEPVLQEWQQEIEKFREKRKQYLLY